LDVAALTLRVDGLCLRAIAHGGQFSGVDVRSSTTRARFRTSSDAALTIALDAFILRITRARDVKVAARDTSINDK
jgi:hypothetical protein